MFTDKVNLDPDLDLCDMRYADLMLIFCSLKFAVVQDIVNYFL